MRSALFLVLALPACFDAALPGDYARVLPDERVEINLPTAYGGAARAGWSEFYLFTAEVTEDVNGFVGAVLGLVDTVTDYPPAWSAEEEDTALWGPWADPLDPVETLLSVHYDAETDVYTWVFAQRPKNDAAADWTPVVAGTVDAGATEITSSGQFAVDFSAMHELDPTSDAVGVFACEYAVDDVGVTGTAWFEGFAEREGWPTTDAIYGYEQAHGGDGAMDLAHTVDLSGGGAPEVLVVRSRWQQTGAGRADAYATGGDLGEEVATASECWGTSFSAVWRVESWSGLETGDEGLCAFADAEYPALAR